MTNIFASIAEMYIPPTCRGAPPDPYAAFARKECDTTKKENIHHLHIELTQEQYRLLCQQAKQCGLTKRGFLARLIDGQPIKARSSQEIRELRTEVYRIGTNINQIARSVNVGIATVEDAKYGLHLLDRVYDLMYQIAKK